MTPIVHTGGTSRSTATFAAVDAEEAVRHYIHKAYLVRLADARSQEPDTPEHFYFNERFDSVRPR